MNNLTEQEQGRRKALAAHMRTTVPQVLQIEDADETSLMTQYEGFYLQISFSELHPLMVFYLACGLKHPHTQKGRRLVNGLNLKSTLGSHALNDAVGCYSYRAAHWLDCELTAERFLEMLERCTEEAKRAYSQLAEVHSS